MERRHTKGACRTCNKEKRLPQSNYTQCAVCYLKEKYPVAACVDCGKVKNLRCSSGTRCMHCWQVANYPTGKCVTCGGTKKLRYKKKTQCFTCRFDRARYKGDVASVSAKTGICEFCLKREVSDVDHDHLTMQVRSKLCHVCNKALGMFWDDSDVMRRAASYVDYHRTPPARTGAPEGVDTEHVIT